MRLCRCFYSFTYFLWTIYDFKMVVEPFETLMWPCAKIYLKEYFEFIIPLLHWIFWWKIKYYSLLFSDFYEMWHLEYEFNSDNIWKFLCWNFGVLHWLPVDCIHCLLHVLAIKLIGVLRTVNIVTKVVTPKRSIIYYY